MVITFQPFSFLVHGIRTACRTSCKLKKRANGTTTCSQESPFLSIQLSPFVFWTSLHLLHLLLLLPTSTFLAVRLTELVLFFHLLSRAISFLLAFFLVIGQSQVYFTVYNCSMRYHLPFPGVWINPTASAIIHWLCMVNFMADTQDCSKCSSTDHCSQNASYRIVFSNHLTFCQSLIKGRVSISKLECCILSIAEPGNTMNNSQNLNQNPLNIQTFR